MKWETLITAVCCVAFATGCTSDPYKSMKTPKAAKRTSPLSGTGTPTPKRRKPVIDFSDLKPAKRDTSGDPPILDQTIPTSMPKVDPIKKLLNTKSKQSLLLGKKKSLSFGADTGLGNGGGFGLGQKKSGGLLGGSPGLSLGGLSLNSSLNPNLPSSGLGDDKDTDTDTDTDTNDPPSSQPTSQPSSRPVATTKPVAPVQNDPDTDLVPNPPKNEYPKDGIIAKINERPIKAIDFERSLVLREKLFMLQKSRAPSAEEVLKLKKSTLKALISQILLYQRAKQRGVTVSDKEKSLARQQFMSSLPPGQKVEDFLKVSKMTRAQFEQRFLEQVVLQKYMKLLATEIQVHPSKLKRLYKETMGDGEVKARHIVVTLSEDASEKDKAAAELRAKKLLAMVRQSGADFASIAKKYSQDPSSEEGGDLGYIKRGEILKDLEKVIFSMNKGDIKGPIQSPIGLHIVKVESKKPPPPFAKVYPQLLRQFQMKKLKKRLESMAEQLRTESDVEIFVKWGK